MQRIYSKIIFFVLVGFAPLTLGDSFNFTEFVEMVKGNISSALSFVLPTDNGEFLDCADLDDINIYGEFDFIIVGSGSGAVLANRLTESNTTSVLLLEAGGEDNEFTSILGMGGYTFLSKMNWGYNTTEQCNACQGIKNKQCFIPRGKVLGGSSTITGGGYLRGNKQDFNEWEGQGNPGWSYEDVLPYFIKSENALFANCEDQYHGKGGLFNVDYASDTPNLTSTIISAFGELGQKQLDYNGKSQLGFGKIQFVLDHNKRENTARAFIRGAQDRCNLNISLNSFVTKVLITSNKAYGVEFVKEGKKYVAIATKEVLLSAGAVNSPQILMLSGIGPAEDLRNLGIQVIADLPVGKNLKELLYYPSVCFRMNQTFFNESLEEDLERWLDNLRPLTGAYSSEIISFINLDGTNTSRPDLAYVAVTPPGANRDIFWGMDKEYAEAFQQRQKYNDMCFITLHFHPKSSGSVTLKSANPRDYPVINGNYLTEECDVETFYQGIQYILQLNNTESFTTFEAHFHHMAMPTCDPIFSRFSKDWWYCAIRALAIPLPDPVGTTRMGNDSCTSVVNSKLQVHGISGLRVVGAGVIPSPISGHSLAAKIMIAEKISDEIKQKYCNENTINPILKLNVSIVF